MSILDKVEQSTPVEDRYPFLPAGTHKVAVLSVSEFTSLKNGLSVATEWVVLESDNPSVRQGSVYANMFLVSRQPKFPGDQQELNRLVHYCGKLAGAEDHEGSKKATKDILGRQEGQPARGKTVIVRCTDKPTKKPDGKGGFQMFTERTYEYVAQTGEELAAMRAQVDQHFPMRAKGKPVPPPIPQPSAPVPLGSFFGK